MGVILVGEFDEVGGLPVSTQVQFGLKTAMISRNDDVSSSAWKTRPTSRRAAQVVCGSTRHPSSMSAHQRGW